MKPTKVLFDGHHLGRRQTGNETYAREMARALARREDVDLILAVDRGRLRAADGVGASVTNELPRNPIGRLAALSILARQRQADVVHSMYYLPPGRTGRTVVSVHDVSYERFPEFFSWRERTKNRILIGDAIRRAGAIVTLTDHARSEILDVYRVDRDRIFVVPCGVAPAFLRAGEIPRPVGDGRLRLLAVGSLQPRKNILRLIAAVRLLAERRPVHLSLIGPEGYQARAITDAVGSGASVEFLGYVSQARLIQAYRTADIFVYPSIYEGFGLPVIEAMACGTPVVTSTGGSLPEVAGDAAVVVNPTDVVAIAAGIARVADDGALRSRLMQEGRLRARQYTWPDAAGALLGVYRELVNRC